MSRPFKIQYPPHTSRAVKERINAIVWATYQQPESIWMSTNVIADIEAFLNEHGYQEDSRKHGTRTRSRDRIKNALDRLEEMGLGIVDVQGKRTCAFALVKPVAYHEPGFVQVSKAARTANEVAVGGDPRNRAAVRPPLPKPPKPDFKSFPVFIRLNELLSSWYESDPDAAFDWIVDASKAIDRDILGNSDDGIE